MKKSGCTNLDQNLSLILRDFRHSSFFYFMSMVKNLLEILLASVFVFYNSAWISSYSEKDDPGICDIPIFGSNVREERLGKVEK